MEGPQREPCYCRRMSDELEGLHPAVRGLRVVCRCNNIRYRTIEKAVEQGARTIAAVATDTRATTGHCGGTCTPKIQAMIDRTNGVTAAADESQAGAEGDAMPDLDAWWIRKES